MTAALLRKELRALAPLAALVLAILLTGLGYTLCTEFPDQQPFTPERFHSEGGLAVTATLFAVLIGAGLLLRESEEGTLHFLDALPISRGHIFLAKILAAGLVLAAVPMLDLLLFSALGALSRSSIDPPLPWRFAGAALGLAWVAAFAVFSVALAFSFSRQWFAFAVGFALWGYLFLAACGVPWIEFLNPFALEPAALGGAVRIPWRHAAVQAGIGAVAMAMAFVGFLQLGARSRDLGDRLAAGRYGRWFSAASKLATPAIWITALILLGRSVGGGGNDKEAGNARPLGEDAFARQETAHYAFLFRERQRAAAQPIVAAADAIYAQVAEFYGMERSLGGRIVVDLASPVVSHAAGQTNWTKIRIPLAASAQGLDALRPILGHETAHVFSHMLSGNALVRLYPFVRFFDEGFASYVEQEFVPEADQGAMWQTAAAASSRGKVPFSLLCDGEKLAKTRDENVAYPLGLVFCRALIETCGKEAPARLLGALAKRDRIAGLSGEALWRAAMQACGFSLDRMVAAYDAEIARLLREEADLIAKLPRLTGRVEVVGEEVLIHAEHSGMAPGGLICEVQTSTGLGTEAHHGIAGEDGVIRFPRAYFPAATARYMLGWTLQELRLPVFEPWTEAEL